MTRRTRRLLAIIGVAPIMLALLVLVLVVRTLMLKPADLSMQQAPAVVAFDLNLAAERLGQAIRFETVSHQDSAENDVAQWTAFHDWMAQTYPAWCCQVNRLRTKFSQPRPI